MVAIDEADRCTAICEKIAAQLDQPFLRAAMARVSAVRAQVAGDVELADRLSNEALKIATEAGMPDAMVFYGGQLFGVYQQRGTLPDLIPLLEEIVAGSPDVASVAASGLANAYVDAGRIEEARRLLDDASHHRFDMNLDYSWIATLAMYADVAYAIDDAAAAMQLLELMEPWADQWSVLGDTLAAGPVLYYLGCLSQVLGRDDEAEAWFARSAAMCESMGAKYWAARTRLRLSELLVARNDHDDTERARALLEEVRAAAVANGYNGLHRDAATALQHLT
jgi:hypothetical protein